MIPLLDLHPSMGSFRVQNFDCFLSVFKLAFKDKSISIHLHLLIISKALLAEYNTLIELIKEKTSNDY